jgi:hypothetical protein
MSQSDVCEGYADLVWRLPAETVGGPIFDMLVCRDLIQLDSATLSTELRMVLHSDIFPRSSPRLLYVFGERQLEVCLWLLHRNIPVLNVDIRSNNVNNELLAQKKHLIRGEVTLKCRSMDELNSWYGQLQKYGSNDMISRLQCFASTGGTMPFLESMQCTNLKSLAFFGNPSCDTTPWLEWCLQICPTVTDVYVSDMQNLTTESFELPAFTCGTLTTVHLQRCGITNAMVLCVGRYCRALQNFFLHETTLWYLLESSAVRQDPLQETGLVAIAEGCPRLQEVSFPEHMRTVGVLQAFAGSCPRLRALRTPNCAISARTLHTLSTNCPGLVELSAEWGKTINADLRTASDGTSAAQLLSGLRVLEVTLRANQDWEVQVDEAVLAFSRCCRRLTRFTLCCTTLKSVTVYPPLGAALAALAQNNPSVTAVTLQGFSCDQSSDTHMAVVAQSWPMLHTLEVEGGLGDAALTAFARNCHRLNNVMCPGAVQLTNRSVLTLAEYCHELLFVHLPHSLLVSEAALLKLVQNTPRLYKLTVPVTMSTEARERLEAAALGAAGRTKPYGVAVQS